MGLFSAIGKLFGGNSGGAIDSRIAIKGDISPIPQNMITPDYRPQNGEYIITSADLLRTWVGVKQMEEEQSPCEAPPSWVDGKKQSDHRGG